MKKIGVMALALALMLAQFTPAWSLGVDQFTFGIIVRLSGTEMTVLEYDFESDAEVERVYVIDQGTRLENIRTLTELLANDSVDIYFREESGRRIATSILKTAHYDEDEWSDEELEEGEEITDDAYDSTRG